MSTFEIFGLVFVVGLMVIGMSFAFQPTKRRRAVRKLYDQKDSPMKEAALQKGSVPLMEWSEMDEKAVEFGITEFSMPGVPDVRLRPVSGGFVVIHKGEKVARMVVDGADLRIEGRVVHQVKLNIKEV